MGDVGIFSLGRGKNITCGSGGLIVTGSETIGGALAAVTREMRSPSPAHDVASFLTLLLLTWFILPRLYWFPSGLPFLRLGETIFHEEFPLTWMSDFEAQLLRGWQERLATLDAVRRAHADYYLSGIDALADGPAGMSHSQPASLARGIPFVRVPVFLPERADRDRLLDEQNGRALGIGTMYPASVAKIPQLANRLEETSFPRAEVIAQRLITLPTHPLVTRNDRVRICALVNQCCSRGREARMAS